ncbi:MAG TPA: hypothetical protein VD999_07280 [Vitreimonas sp.]|nr:hypothetical protein [Vitreimonas sp.]
MTIVIHGEHTAHSRQKLSTVINQHQTQHIKMVRLEAKRITEADLEMALGSESLFNEPKVVVIEELHSLPKSKRKDTLIDQLSQHALDTDLTLIIWEKRTLTATMLKKFPKAEVFEFKLSSTLFKWLESLSSDQKTKAQQLKYFHQTLETEDEFMCLSMLARQIRMLIQTKEGATLSGAPFMIAKLKKQAGSISLEQLLATHARLLEIELKHKTSSTPLTLRQDLDLLLLQL